MHRYTPRGQKLQINPSHLAHPMRGQVLNGLVGAGLATGCLAYVLTLGAVVLALTQREMLPEDCINR
jgi:hypothetical protein